MDWTRWRPLLVGGLLLAGCQVRGIIGSNEDTLGVSTSGVSSTTDQPVTTESVTSDATGSSGSNGPDSTGEIILDVPMACAPPSPPSCDGQDDDPWHALGLDCPGGVEVETAFTGSDEAIAVVDGPVATLHHRDGAVGAVNLRDGTRVAVSALYVQPRGVPACPFVETLGCATEDQTMGAMVTVDAMMRTSVQGVYAAGDLTRPMFNALFAASDGAMAGIACHRSLMD